MSAQNSLKKPEFKKTMWGYAPEDVDAYLAYVNERYTSVCRESAELKRKLTRFLLGMDKPNSATVQEEVKLPSERELSLLRSRLEECLRQASAVEAILSDAAALIETAKEVRTESEKYVEEQVPAENALAFDIRPVFQTESPSDTPAKVFAEATVPEEPEAPIIEASDSTAENVPEAHPAHKSASFTVAHEETVSENSETEVFEEDSEKPKGSAPQTAKYSDFKLFDGFDDEEDFSSFAPVERVTLNESPSSAEELPAEEMQDAAARKAADELHHLDFHTDEVHRDGESYDPMTLAMASRKKPTLSDLMRPPYENSGK